MVSESKDKRGVWRRSLDKLYEWEWDTPKKVILSRILTFKKQLRSAAVPDLLIETLFLESHIRRYIGDYEHALRAAKKAVRIADEHNLSALHIDALLDCALCARKMGDLRTCESFTEFAVRLSRKRELRKQEGKAYYARGKLYEARNQLDIAVTCFWIAKHYASQASDYVTQLDTLADLGSIETARGNYVDAFRYIQEGLDLNSDRGGISDHTWIKLFFREGDVYRAIHDFDRAESSYNASANLAKGLDIPSEFVESYLRLGRLYLDREDYDKAIDSFTTAAEMSKKYHHPVDKLELDLALVIAYNGKGWSTRAIGTAWNIVDSVEAQPEQYHVLLSSTLEQLLVAYDRLGQTTDSTKLANLVERFRSTARTGADDTHKVRQLRQSVYSEMKRLLPIVRQQQLVAFEIRGRHINLVSGYIVTENGENMGNLTPTEMAVLRYLISFQGQPVSFLDLAEEIFPGARNNQVKNWHDHVKVYIHGIRKKLQDKPGGSIIMTVRKVGWLLSDL